MINIHELERRWLRYKIKSLLPLMGLAILGIIIFGAIVLYQNDLLPLKAKPTAAAAPQPAKGAHTPSADTPQQDVPPAQEQPPKAVTSKDAPETPAAENDNKSVTEAVEEKPAVTLAPSMQFLSSIQEDITQGQKERPAAKQTIKTPQSKPQEPQNPVAEERPVTKAPALPETKPQTMTVEPPQETSITIITREDADDLKDVINRFKKNKNPALSLFVAKRYYELQQYQKAYNYALITNEINNDIEDSWLIFAKSLVKMGQKDKAVATLKSHLKQSDSPKARMLLEDIIQGRFQ